MNSFVHRAHIWLGLVVALPVLLWASSGLLYALPGAVEGGQVETIDASRVGVSPAEAVRRADEFAGRKLPVTALTLLVRGGRPVYQVVGGMGGDSLLVDAATGEVVKTPPAGAATRYFNQAHFYFFAGRWQVPALLLLSGLACLSAATGVYLNAALWLARRRARPSRG